MDILKKWWLSVIIGLVIGFLITIPEAGVPAINLLAMGGLAGGLTDGVKELLLYFSDLGGASWKNLGLGFLSGIVGALITIIL